MVYIGFSKISHKIIANLFCKHFKHCAPVLINGTSVVLYQFTNRNNINKIKMNMRDLKILEKYGWKFIRYNKKINIKKSEKYNSWTCVQFTKKFCDINNIKTQTPDQLLKYLLQK